MTKPNRNERLVYITQYLTRYPNKLIPLSYFTDYLQAAKSSISEDIKQLRQFLEAHDLGTVETISGIHGGVIYHLGMSQSDQDELIDELIQELESGKRILPGNYIQVMDLLQNPDYIQKVAQLMAMKYQDQDVDVVVTIETKGVGLAAAVAHRLNVPYVVVRRNPTETMGSTMSVNYVSGSFQTVMKMELPLNSMKKGDRALIVDDFIRNGGSAAGLIDLIHEFGAELVDTCVLVENTIQQPSVINFSALISVELNYYEEKGGYALDARPGNFFEGQEGVES